MDKCVIHEGWLEISSESSNSKSWLKISTKRTWKRKYLVLYRQNEDSDEIYLAAYEKEDWQNYEAKKILRLFPSFKVVKPFNMKGNKEHVLEVSNTSEKLFLSSSKGKIIDLWAIQIQMQMKLSRVISGRIFSVSGTLSKQLQRIGAAQERCLLHLTKWGVTLALQDSRSILALWPLSTIRNYEYSGQCQFTIEAGRRAPMGEGVYTFHTNLGQDEEIFNVLDALVVASLQEKAQVYPNRGPEITDDDILKCYDELHKSAIGLNPVFPDSSYDRITHHSTQQIPLPQREPSIHKPPDYNRLFNEHGQRKGSNSSENFHNGGNYDQLNRKVSQMDVQDFVVDLPAQNYDMLNKPRDDIVENGYDHIGAASHAAQQDQNFYDHISNQNGEPTRAAIQRPAPISPKMFPLRDEPSVPFLLDGNSSVPFTGRSPLSSSVSSCRSDKFIFRNSIYASANTPESEDGFVSAGSFSSTTELIPLDGRSNSNASDISRHDSNSSELKFNLSRNKHSSSFKDKSIHDIADHFLYHVPSQLQSPVESEESYGNLQSSDIYQNSNVEQVETCVDEQSRRPPLTLPKRRKRSASEHIVSEKLENPFRHRQKRHVSDVNPDIHLELWDGDITYPDGSWNRLVNGVRVGESIHKFCCLSKPHCPKEFLNNLLFPPSANGVVNDWYAQEINNYDFDTGTKVIDNVQVKHFSNIVWRNTTEIGCAQAVDSSGRCIYTIALYKLEGSIGTPEEFKSNIGGVVAAESDSNNNFILIIFLAVLFVALLIGLVVLCYCCRDRLRDKYMKIKIKTDTMKAEQELETDSTRFWWLRICRDKKVKRRRTTVTRPKTFSIKERPTIEVVPNSPPARSRPSIPRARGQSNAADFLIRYQGIGQKAENYVPYRDQPLPTAPKDPNTSKRPLPTAPIHSETAPLKPKQPLTKLPSLPKENDAASGTKRPVHRTSSSGKPPPPPVPQSVSQSPSNFKQPQTPKFSQPINPPPRPVKSLPPPPAAVLPPKPVKNSPKTPLRPISVPATQNKPKPIPRKNTAPIFPPEPAKSSPPTKPKPPTVSTGGTEDNNAPKSVAELRKFLEKK